MTRELLESIRAELAANAEPKFREALVWFFKQPVDPYGVSAAVVRKMAATLYRQIKHWPAAERDRLCRELWRSGKLEEGVLVSHVYRRFGKQCGRREFRLFEKWLGRFVTNWATCDGVAAWLLGAAIENEPALISELPGWTRSKNRWKRRAAAVSLLREAKRGRHTSVIFEIAARLASDPDDMVRKGIGWLLKETYPQRPRETLKFLQTTKGSLPRLVLRIAAEKMTAADRATLLGPR